MSGRLNSFQQTMLQWNDLHPYNAAHVVRVPVQLAFKRLQGAVSRTLETRGLNAYQVDRKRGTFRYGPSPSEIKIPIVGKGEIPREALGREVARQLNLRFPLDGVVQPFRFFVVPEADAFSLGLVYLHVCADAESIVRLLGEIAGVFLGRGDSGPDATWELYPAPRDRLLFARPWTWLRALLAVPGQVRQIRRASRLQDRDPGDMSNEVLWFGISPEELDGLVAAGKRMGSTVHDLLLALLMKSLAVALPERLPTGRRRRMAVGSIVNIRRDVGQSGGGAFGVFLGSFVVSHEVSKETGLVELAVAIQEKTQRIKRLKLYLATPGQLAFARVVLGFFSTQRRRRFYQKHYPLWAGITNMNLNSLWGPGLADRPMVYWRAVSTGPVTPLVLSATTLGRAMQIGLSYRTTVFSAADVRQIKENLTRAIGQLSLIES